jgi:homoserine kinase type II
MVGSCFPTPIDNLQGETFLPLDDRLWEACTWQPGSPAVTASDEQLASAVRSIDAWHRAIPPSLIRDGDPLLAPTSAIGHFLAGRDSASPGLLRRRDEWRRLSAVAFGNRMASLSSFTDPERLAERTLRQAERHVSPMSRWLHDADLPRRLCVCLRDVHGEHVLFTGTAVTGIVDFGAIGLDHPAIDFGRLLGSLAPDDRARWHNALAGIADADAFDLAWRFDRTGTLLGALHWLEWLVISPREFANRAAAYARWRSLVERIERWSDE